MVNAASAQQPSPAPPAVQAAAAAQNATAPPAPPQLPDHKTLELNQWVFWAVYQESEGPVKKGRGNVQLEGKALMAQADEMEFNEDTHELVAVGNVYYHSFEKNEQIWCDRLEYNTEEQKGKFYNVRGESMPKTVVRRGILSGNSPFHFEGKWAERIGDQYMLYDGWITNCKMPEPWWKLRGPKFDIILDDRAVAYKSTFLLRKMPIFFTPYFYHSLEKRPRHSGFLLPNLVAHSQRGPMVGLGYFWAISRSFDVTYRFFDYNTDAFAHHVDFRGKPREGTDFDVILYGVQDRQGVIPGTTPAAALQRHQRLCDRPPGPGPRLDRDRHGKLCQFLRLPPGMVGILQRSHWLGSSFHRIGEQGLVRLQGRHRGGAAGELPKR